MEENQITDEMIFSKIGEIMKKLNANNKLHDLAESKGLNVKNSVKLSDNSIDNYAVSIIALLLAKRNDDPQYKVLVQTGIQKRSLKTEVINKYKDQANQIMTQYKNRLLAQSSQI